MSKVCEITLSADVFTMRQNLENIPLWSSCFEKYFIILNSGNEFLHLNRSILQSRSKSGNWSMAEPGWKIDSKPWKTTWLIWKESPIQPSLVLDMKLKKKILTYLHHSRVWTLTPTSQWMAFWLHSFDELHFEILNIFEALKSKNLFSKDVKHWFSRLDLK